LSGILKRHSDESKYYAEARAIQEKLVEIHPHEPGYRTHLAQTLHAWGEALGTSGNKKEAENALRLAVKHQQVAFSQAPNVANQRKTLSLACRALSDFLRGAGKLDEALDMMFERRKLWTNNSGILYDVARDLAKAAAGIAAAVPRARWETAALDTLEMAVAAGFRDRKRLLAEPAFQPLAGREKFQAVLSQLGH
jgi:hypothetical protein